MQTEKHLYARFHGPEIFLEQGRILYSLLYAFHSAGYRIHLHASINDQPLERYARMVYELSGLTTYKTPVTDTLAAIYLCDEAAWEDGDAQWSKTLRVRFDLFSPYWSSDPIIVPYNMYPQHTLRYSAYDLIRLRQTERKMRIFFSGDTEHYRRIWIRYPRVKIPREPVIQAIRKRFEHSRLLHDVRELESLISGPYLNACVLTASKQVWIETSAWLPILARSDFLICPPGIVMPMSHNIIEAMAVGTIPITNYPEWMDPPLRHGRECLAFDSIEDLFSVLRQALQMRPEDIRAMRTAVVEYYERHLRPDRFVSRVEAHPDPEVTLLLYSERNVALNAKRLGRGSILLQGTALPRPRGVWRRMAAVYFPNLYRALNVD